jgi:hypothetical protein
VAGVFYHTPWRGMQPLTVALWSGAGALVFIGLILELVGVYRFVSKIDEIHDSISK